MNCPTVQPKTYQKISKAIKNLSFTLQKTYQKLSKQNKSNQPAIFLKEEKFILNDLSFLTKQKFFKNQTNSQTNSYLLHSFL